VNIGLLTAANPQLRPQVGTDASAQGQTETVVETAVVAAKPRPTVNVAPSIRYPSMRAALDAQIAADVSSGALSHGDATAVSRTLDAIDRRLAGPGKAIEPASAVRAYLATIPRGTLVDRAA